MRLIQTGKFKNEGKELFGRTGLVDLDYMGEKVFQTDLVPKSYKIIMHDFENYGYFSTCIPKEHDELILFCNKEQVKEELNFISKNKDLFINSDRNFWWDALNCWMLFPYENMIDFEKSIKRDHDEWWMQRPEIEREHDYKLSLKRKSTIE